MAEGKPRCDERVARVLQSAGLSEFEGVFAAEHVDFEALLVITVEDLADMGLRKGHVAKLRSNLLALYGSRLPRNEHAGVRDADLELVAGVLEEVSAILREPRAIRDRVVRDGRARLPMGPR